METTSLPVTQVHLPLPPVLTAASSVSGLPDQMSRFLRGYQTRQWTSCCWPRKCRLPQKAFISRLGLILDPRRDGREANEYRRGNVSLCAPHQQMHTIFIYTYAQSLDTSIQILHTKTALSFPRLLVSSINIHRNERGNARLHTHKHTEFICCVKLIHRDQQLGKSHYEREWLWNQSGLLSTQVNACVSVCARLSCITVPMKYSITVNLS